MNYINFAAFISLLIFFLIIIGVLYKMSNPDRVLIGTELYGSRIMHVDSLGNGDYTTIQSAIDAAQGETPAADSRWLVMVAPGEYQESLTLYDYVDISGYAPGHTAHLISPSNQAAIDNGAEVTISNLKITGENDPVIRTDTATDTMRFVNCVTDNNYDEVIIIQSTAGTIEVIGSLFTTQGRTFYVTTGTLKLYDSVFIRDGGENEAVMDLNGAATIEAHRCSFINSGAGGGPAIKINSIPTSFIMHHCLFRESSGGESIATTVIPTIYLGACVADVALDAAILGTHDVQVDANY